MNDMIVLAGGFGTRIQSVSKSIPKSLLPVGNKVFLDYIMDWLAEYEIKRVVLSLHHKSDQFLSYIKNHKYDFEIIPIIEPEPLGTGGAVKYVLENIEISNPFGVVNGDTLFDFDLTDMSNTFDRLNCSTMIGLSHVSRPDRFGTVRFDENTNLALSFDEKIIGGSGWINNGCYIFNTDVFSKFDGAFSIEKDFFPELVKAKKLSVHPVRGKFLDIGVPAAYNSIVENLY